MPEVKFVIKSLVIALIVTICMQAKVGSESIENHALHWMRTSSVPVYLQGVASGAVLAIRNVANASGDYLGKTFGHDSFTQKAGRFHFEFKRSPQSQKEQSNE